MKIFRLILTLLISMWFVSCDDSNQCGCKSDSLLTLNDEFGEISFKKQLDPSDEYYNDKYWMSYSDSGCSGCLMVMIVCNEEILGEEFTPLLDSTIGPTYKVLFSGKLQEICQKTFNPSNISYNRITLSKIQKL